MAVCDKRISKVATLVKLRVHVQRLIISANLSTNMLDANVPSTVEPTSPILGGVQSQFLGGEI
jgi:hypothetical protein